MSDLPRTDGVPPGPPWPDGPSMPDPMTTPGRQAAIEAAAKALVEQIGGEDATGEPPCVMCGTTLEVEAGDCAFCAAAAAIAAYDAALAEQPREHGPDHPTHKHPRVPGEPYCACFEHGFHVCAAERWAVLCGEINYERRVAAEQPREEREATCTCRKAPEGMLGWDRSMVDPKCPLHGHEALAEERIEMGAALSGAPLGPLPEQPREDWSKFDPMRLAPAGQPREEESEADQLTDAVLGEGGSTEGPPRPEEGGEQHLRAEQPREDVAQEAREHNSAAAHEASDGKYGQPLTEQPPEEQECICGHERRFHKHASDAYPALCTYEVAPGEDEPICHCLEFEADPPDQEED